jgi:hypothetical protein
MPLPTYRINDVTAMSPVFTSVNTALPRFTARLEHALRSSALPAMRWEPVQGSGMAFNHDAKNPGSDVVPESPATRGDAAASFKAANLDTHRGLHWRVEQPLGVGFFGENGRALTLTQVSDLPWHLHIYFRTRVFAARNPKLGADPISPLGYTR